MTKPADITGQVFEKLTALRRAENAAIGRHAQWLCRCDCGTEIVTRANSLRSGNTRSCGQCSNRFDLFGDTVFIWLARKNGNDIPCAIDAVDYPLVKGYRWHAVVHLKEQTMYAESGTEPKVKMHNLILPLHDLEVDHIDHDGLNNRRENLRPGTRTQNTRNRRKIRGLTSSQYKGVHLHRSGMFRARIQVDKKRIHLGLFNTEQDAARAYNEAAKKHHGEFAELNELDDVSNLILGGAYANGPLRGQKPQ